MSANSSQRENFERGNALQKFLPIQFEFFPYEIDDLLGSGKGKAGIGFSVSLGRYASGKAVRVADENVVLIKRGGILGNVGKVRIDFLSIV